MSDQEKLRHGYHDLLRPEILKLIPTNAKTILDLGCGTGKLGAALKQRQRCFVEGIELNKEAAQIARQNLDDVWQDNLNRFDPSFLPRKYDCIIFADILEHLLYPWTVLKKFTGVLNDDGVIVASIPNIAHPWIVSQLQKGLWRYEPAGILDFTHLRFFTKTSICQLFYKAGLKIISIQPHPSNQNPAQLLVIGKKPKLKYKNPDTTILILSYNTWYYTNETLKSIKQFTNAPYKILVVDNGSTDETVENLRKDETIFHIENTTNLGFGRGFNIGLELIDTPYFVLSNSDVVVTPNWLTTMKKNMEVDIEILAIGPRSNYVSGPQVVINPGYNDLKSMLTFAETKAWPGDKSIRLFPRIVFFFTLFRSEVLGKIGFFDERFEIGNFEDDDYCMRIWRSGYKCAIDNSVFIHHYGSKSFVANKIEYTKVMEVNKERFIKKWKLKEV